jgi:hypothetical protein
MCQKFPLFGYVSIAVVFISLPHCLLWFVDWHARRGAAYPLLTSLCFRSPSLENLCLTRPGIRATELHKTRSRSGAVLESPYGIGNSWM